MSDLVEVPEDVAWEIDGEELNAFLWVADRDGEVWAVTTTVHEGDVVLFPFAGDMRPATRAIVDDAFGPLRPEPHCPVCGTTGFWKDGVCAFRNDSRHSGR